MGFHKPIDYGQVYHQIRMTGAELYSHYNDGYVQFELKKELYKIKWLVDNILKDSPTFSGEKEFIDEHEKELVWKTLSK
jgi:hypothetical protein